MAEQPQSEPTRCSRDACRALVPAERMVTLTGRKRRSRFGVFCSEKCMKRAASDRWLNKPGVRDWQTELGRRKREKNPKLAILIRSRQNAKMRMLEHTLTEADIPDIPTHCPVFTWIKLVYRVGQTGRGRKRSMMRHRSTASTMPKATCLKTSASYRRPRIAPRMTSQIAS